MPVSGKQTHKTWGVRQRNAIQPHSTWTDLEDVMLCDLGQSQRDKHRMIPPVRGPRGAEFAETGSRRRCQGRAVNGGGVPRAGPELRPGGEHEQALATAAGTGCRRCARAFGTAAPSGHGEEAGNGHLPDNFMGCRPGRSEGTARTV